MDKLTTILNEGYLITTRSSFEKMYELDIARLTRLARYHGEYVIFDPFDDPDDGYMVIGDDKEKLLDDCITMRIDIEKDDINTLDQAVDILDLIHKQMEKAKADDDISRDDLFHMVDEWSLRIINVAKQLA